jgi:hypothetical protein
MPLMLAFIIIDYAYLLYLPQHIITVQLCIISVYILLLLIMHYLCVHIIIIDYASYLHMIIINYAVFDLCSSLLFIMLSVAHNK